MALYLILRELVNDGEVGSWQERVTVDARSARAAVQTHLEAEKTKEGRYVAVPARSFKPLEATVETQTKLSLT